MEEREKFIFILLAGIISFFMIINFTLGAWVLGILAIIFGFKNKENTLAKIGFILGILTITLLILIKIILPITTGISTPLVVFESCSMYHNGEKGFETILKNDIYQNNGIYSKETINWPFQRGLNKGDIIFVVGPKDLEKGDVIIFNGGEKNLIMHRLIKDTEPYATKGDNYITNYAQLTSEKRISEDQLMGKVVFRIPLLGWIKLIFFEPFRDDKGFC